MADDSAEWLDICGDGGCLKKILVEGTGPLPVDGAEVKVHYVGTLKDSGEKFDSSRDRDDHFKFTLGQGRVIKGWDQGVATMKTGEKCILRCRADYAYGDNGSPPKIPGGATLDFEVELFINFDRVPCVDGVEAMTIQKETDFQIFSMTKEDAVVTFDFSLCDSLGENGTLSMSGVSFELGQDETFAEWPAWFHQCLENVQQGGAKVFHVKEREDIPASWGVNSDFYFRVDMQKVENPKDCSDRSTEENIESATKHKERGNAYFKSGKYQSAVNHYKKGQSDLEYEIKKEDNPRDLKEYFGEPFHNLYVTLHSNSAMTHLKLKHFDNGIVAADKVLWRDDKHLKALCRRAQCMAQLGRFAEAEKSCEAALAVDKNNATAKQILKYAKGKVAQEKRRMKTMASRMFGGGKSKKKTAEAGSSEADEKLEPEEIAANEKLEKLLETITVGEGAASEI